MLSKLLKYDLRANIKIFLFIWPAMLAVAGLQRLLLGLGHPGAHALLERLKRLADGLVAAAGPVGQPDAFASPVRLVWLDDDKILRFQPLQHARDCRVRQMEALLKVLRVHGLLLMQRQMVQNKRLRRRQIERQKLLIHILRDAVVEIP